MPTNSNKEQALSFFLKHFANLTNNIKELIEIKVGYSNFIFKLTTTDEQEYKVRIASNNHLIDRGNEKKVIQCINDPLLIFYEDNTGNAIYHWVKGQMATPTDLDDGNIQKIFQLATKYHSHGYVNGIAEHNPLDYAHLVEGNIPAPYTSLYLALNCLYRHIPLVLCHNDISLGNLIFSEEKDEIFLIDYEWARLNSVYWDMGNFIRESQLDRTKIVKLAKIAQLDEAILFDYCYIAVYYALQLTYSFNDQGSFGEYRDKLLSLLEAYRQWCSIKVQRT